MSHFFVCLIACSRALSRSLSLHSADQLIHADISLFLCLLPRFNRANCHNTKETLVNELNFQCEFRRREKKISHLFLRANPARTRALAIFMRKNVYFYSKQKKIMIQRTQIGPNPVSVLPVIFGHPMRQSDVPGTPVLRRHARGSHA